MQEVRSNEEAFDELLERLERSPAVNPDQSASEYLRYVDACRSAANVTQAIPTKSGALVRPLIEFLVHSTTQLESGSSRVLALERCRQQSQRYALEVIAYSHSDALAQALAELSVDVTHLLRTIVGIGTEREDRDTALRAVQAIEALCWLRPECTENEIEETLQFLQSVLADESISDLNLVSTEKQSAYTSVLIPVLYIFDSHADNIDPSHVQSLAMTLSVLDLPANSPAAVLVEAIFETDTVSTHPSDFEPNIQNEWLDGEGNVDLTYDELLKLLRGIGYRTAITEQETNDDSGHHRIVRSAVPSRRNGVAEAVGATVLTERWGWEVNHVRDIIERVPKSTSESDATEPSRTVNPESSLTPVQRLLIVGFSVGLEYMQFQVRHNDGCMEFHGINDDSSMFDFLSANLRQPHILDRIEPGLSLGLGTALTYDFAGADIQMYARAAQRFQEPLSTQFTRSIGHATVLADRLDSDLATTLGWHIRTTTYDKRRAAANGLGRVRQLQALSDESLSLSDCFETTLEEIYDAELDPVSDDTNKGAFWPEGVGEVARVVGCDHELIAPLAESVERINATEETKTYTAYISAIGVCKAYIEHVDDSNVIEQMSVDLRESIPASRHLIAHAIGLSVAYSDIYTENDVINKISDLTRCTESDGRFSQYAILLGEAVAAAVSSPNDILAFMSHRISLSENPKASILAEWRKRLKLRMARDGPANFEEVVMKMTHRYPKSASMIHNEWECMLRYIEADLSPRGEIARSLLLQVLYNTNQNRRHAAADTLVTLISDEILSTETVESQIPVEESRMADVLSVYIERHDTVSKHTLNLLWQLAQRRSESAVNDLAGKIRDILVNRDLKQETKLTAISKLTRTDTRVVHDENSQY